MSNNLMDLLQGQLSEGLLDQLTNQLGGADKQQTAAAATGIISTLIGGLSKNASTPEGASNLADALDRDHDGGVLDNLFDIFGGNAVTAPQPTMERALNGSGIIKHILGDRTSGAVNMISQMSGLDSGKTGNLMTMLAPIVMGALGRQKQQQGLDVGGLVSLLTGTVTAQRQQSTGTTTMDLVTRFLDSDGDGSIMDDMAGFGMKFLGNLFKSR
ncbi:MAG: DUF937 domain-containing protein [Phaeodactylibacter sp.]|nr:DUF937 domain-containing protein [Phaeodactylibacter sp.]